MKFILTAKQSSIESIDMQSDDAYRPYDLYVNSGNANVRGLLFGLKPSILLVFLMFIKKHKLFFFQKSI